MNASKTNLAKRFFLTTVSLLFTVGLLEILVLAKIVDFRLVLGTARSQPWHHPNNLLDPKLLHIRKPYQYFKWAGIEYRYDQHGLRNEADLETADIVVIGDSFIEGWGVSSADLLTSHLGKQLGRTVANLGQSWYGPQQELELLRRYGVQLRPKVCTWVFYEGNDLWDVGRYKEATKNWVNFSKDLHSFRQRSFTKNAIAAMRKLFFSVMPPRDDNAFIIKDWSGVFEMSSGRKVRLIYLQPNRGNLSPVDLEALQLVRASLAEAHELCRKVGAKFWVVFAPVTFRVYKEFLEFDPQAQARTWVANDLPVKLEMIVRNALPGAEFLDLTPALTAKAAEGRLLYFPEWDTHWSPEGHRVAANAIAQSLIQWEQNPVSTPHR